MARWALQITKYFSHRHNITPFGPEVVGDSLLQNLPGGPDVNVTVLQFHTYLLRSVLILLLGSSNDALWFVKGVLKVFSVSPT